MANLEQKGRKFITSWALTLPGDVIWHAEDIDNALHKRGSNFQGEHID